MNVGLWQPGSKGDLWNSTYDLNAPDNHDPDMARNYSLTFADLVQKVSPAVVSINVKGDSKVAECLPPLIEAARKCGRRVVWCSDPMHGNTETTSDGIKTRRFDKILGEVEQSFDIHADLGSFQGGVHFELSGDNVTECVGGARGLSEVDLERAYESRVDPRLNYEQSLEMALLVGRKAEKMNGRA